MREEEPRVDLRCYKGAIPSTRLLEIPLLGIVLFGTSHLCRKEGEIVGSELEATEPNSGTGYDIHAAHYDGSASDGAECKCQGQYTCQRNQHRNQRDGQYYHHQCINL